MMIGNNKIKKIVFILLFIMFFINCTKETAEIDESNQKKEDVSLNEKMIADLPKEIPLNRNNNKNFNPFEKEWSDYEKFKQKGFKETADKILDFIYKKSLEDKKYGNYLKAIAYKLQNALISFYVLEKLLREVDISEFPVKQFLHSIIAEMYWNYFTEFKRNLIENTEKDYKRDDVRTWTYKKIVEETAENYKSSLTSAEDLKKIKLTDFKEIIKFNDLKYNTDMNLYEFLMLRAIDFYSNEEADLETPEYVFNIDNELYLTDYKDFINIKFNVNDNTSFKQLSLISYQTLLKYYSDNKKYFNLIETDINRLNYIYRNISSTDKTAKYIESLKFLINNSGNSNKNVDSYFNIAAKYYNNNDYVSAKKTCDEAIMKFKPSSNLNNCKNLNDLIETKDMFVEYDKETIPDKPFELFIKYKNINSIFVKIIKLTKEDFAEKHSINEMLQKEIIKEYEFKLNNNENFKYSKQNITIDGLPLGEYLLFISLNKNFDITNSGIFYSYFKTTNIALFEKEYSNKIQYYILNRETGKPLTNAKVFTENTIKNYNENKISKPIIIDETIDKFGVFELNFDKEIYKNVKKYDYFTTDININYEKDNIVINKTDNKYYHYYREEDEENNKQIENYSVYFFLDKAIYRPDQKIYFKGLVIDETNKILPNKEIEVEFLDVSYQKISEMILKTNEFGTFSGEYLIPTNLLNGKMHIKSNKGRETFSVEEYKKPTFEILLEEKRKSYNFNEEVIIKGKIKSFAGYNMNISKAKYIVRNAYDKSVNEYELIINSNEFEFKITPTSKELKNTEELYNVSIQATDINGETRNKEFYIMFSNYINEFQVEIDNIFDKNSDKKFNIIVENESYESIPFKGDIEINKIKPPENKIYNKTSNKTTDYTVRTDEIIDDFEDYEIEKKIYSENFDTSIANEYKITNLQNFESGTYSLEIKGKDFNGKEIKDKKYFTVYSKSDKKNPYFISSFFDIEKEEYKFGETAEIIAGTSLKDVNLIYEIEQNGKVFHREFLTLNDEIKIIKIPIKEEYQGNINVFLGFIKDNKSFKFLKNIKIPYETKKLNIKFETFRNKLLPGQEEEWILKIKDLKGNNVFAETAAVLYDASLDFFEKNNWFKNLYPEYDAITIRDTLSNRYDELKFEGCLNSYKYKFYKKEIPILKYFDDFIKVEDKRRYSYDLSREDYYLLKKGFVKNDKLKECSPNQFFSAIEHLFIYGNRTMELQEIRKQTIDKLIRVSCAGGSYQNSDIINLQKVDTRKNFNETAFFYPHLTPNKKGETIIKFKVPEYFTKWKMLGFSHTKDLNYGFVENELVTQKDLMIIPNMPRVLRENEIIYLNSKIVNMSDKDLTGKIDLKLFNGLNDKEISHKMISAVHGEFSSTGERKFSVKKGESVVVDWEIKVIENVDLLKYKIVAATQNHSDGEENIIPVLKNKILITEMIPITLKSLEQKIYKFEKLLNSSQRGEKNYSLSLQFTLNPVWEILKTIPYLLEYPYDCAEQTFSKYYANAISSKIVNSNPKIKEIIESWRKNPKTFQSDIEKNQSLQSILLQESPWLADITNNKEQFEKNIAKLFDLTLLESQKEKLLKKLEENQTSLGGWGWFKGMEENRYITSLILTGFLKLDKLKIIDISKDERIYKLVKNAIYYIDIKIKSDYETLLSKKNDLNTYNISEYQVQYMYIRSYFKDIKNDIKTKEAFDYYKNQEEKYYKQFDVYLKGLIALTFYQLNEENIAKEIVKNIKDNAIIDENGMYFKETYGYYWYQLHIETHALMIEVFNDITKDKESIDNLKIWLLKNKINNKYGSTKATVDVLHSLLLSNENNEIYNEIKVPDITAGNEKITLQNNKNDVSGNIILTFDKHEIKPEMGQIDIKNNNNFISFGALFYKYFENIQDIDIRNKDLTISKKLFIEVKTEKGIELKQIENEELKIGNKILVKVEVITDKPFEFIHIKDSIPSCFEVVETNSGYNYKSGMSYYNSIKDASNNFFIDYLIPGKHELTYYVYVTHKGKFSSGISLIQSMYSPENIQYSNVFDIKVWE